MTDYANRIELAVSLAPDDVQQELRDYLELLVQTVYADGMREGYRQCGEHVLGKAKEAARG